MGCRVWLGSASSAILREGTGNEREHLLSCDFDSCIFQAAAVEVDPDCDGGAGRGSEDDPIDAAGDSVSLVDSAAAGLYVVAVDDLGGSVVPAAVGECLAGCSVWPDAPGSGGVSASITVFSALSPD